MMTKRKEQSAADKFLAAKCEIDESLAQIAAYSAEHFGCNPYTLDHGHAGTLNDIKFRLADIAQMLKDCRMTGAA